MNPHPCGLVPGRNERGAEGLSPAQERGEVRGPAEADAAGSQGDRRREIWAGRGAGSMDAEGGAAEVVPGTAAVPGSSPRPAAWRWARACGLLRGSSALTSRAAVVS